MNDFKSCFIAIVGRPNAGKSTVLNSLLGEKIAITTSRPQTTRNRILGILNRENSQIVFVDTPGVHKPRTKLGEYMNKAAIGSIENVDAALFMVDAEWGLGDAEERIMKQLRDKGIPAVLAINKVDLVQKEKILPLISEFSEAFSFDAIVPISAKTGDGIKSLQSELEKYLAPGPMFYPDDMITDKTEREIMAEIIREKLLKFLDKEIPHGVAVEINQMKDENNILRVTANIFCEKASHKSIIIGKGGAMLKKIGSYAREDGEKFFGRKIFLEMWVKVKDDWRNSNFMLKSLGYSDEE